MITREWKDFVLSSTNEPITKIAERFDAQHGKRIIRRDDVDVPGEELEAMQISDHANIAIWTTTRVWCVLCKMLGPEQFIWAPRTPSVGASTKEWRNFVVSSAVAPIMSNRDRFDLIHVDYPEQIVHRDSVEILGDEFEAMEITDRADITVWTTTRVWCLIKGPGLERLLFLPRNPPGTLRAKRGTEDASEK